MRQKFLQLTIRPKVLVFLWLTYLLSPVLSVFRHYFISGKNIFNIHIINLSSLLYYFPFFISFVAFLILVIWFKNFIDKKLPKTHRKALLLLSILSGVFLMFAIILLILEQNNYPNFLYSHFGLTASQIESMSFVATLQLFVFFFLLLYNHQSFKQLRQNNLYKINGFANKKKYSLFFVLTGLSGLMILSVYPFISWTRLWGEVKGGYESRVGTHYKYIVLLVKYSPIDANIIHPPQGEKWPAIGNQPVLRYFLYPRTLISGALLDNQKLVEQIGTAYFVEIDPHSDLTHWPKADEKNKTIVFNEHTEIKYKIIETIFKSDEGSVYRVSF